MENHFHGIGLGLRTPHFQTILDTSPPIDWFEIISENFMVPGGKPKYFLHQIRERYPMAMHGVSLSIGSTDPINTNYLKALKQLIDEVNPIWVSDHLCWTGVQGTNTHDLLPLPYNETTIKHLVSRIKQVQDYLERPILLENVSSYLTYKDSDMTEWHFYNAVCEQANCYMLLDINNIYVSARNHNFDPEDYLNAVSAERVRQFHLAGHTDYGDYVIDTHDHDVRVEVWQLYQIALKRFGKITTLIERDDHIPPLDELMLEVQQARQLFNNVFKKEQELESESV